MADVQRIEDASDGEGQSSKAPTMDPIMDMARVLGQLLHNEGRIDQLEVQGGGQPKQRIDLWRRTNLQAIEGVEQVISAVPASELDEAAIQILIAAGYASTLADEAWDVGLKDTAARLALLLRSALPVVARKAGVDLQAFGAERYGQGPRNWPFHPVQGATGDSPRLKPIAPAPAPAPAPAEVTRGAAQAAANAHQAAVEATAGIA